MSIETERPWVLTDVSLIIEGRDLHPEEITPIMGIEPTASRNPGPPSRWERVDEFNGIWRVSCDEHTTRDFLQQLNFILETMEGRREELARLADRGHEVFISVYGFAGNDSSISLPPEEVKRIALLGFPLKVAANMNER